jgi:Mycothiol maleylpyruvate isomerase N-terminal domain
MEGNSMGTKSEALAKQFEAKVREAMATLEKLNDADWKKVTEAEKWPVGVTAHHLAGGLEPISNMVKGLVAGQSLEFTNDMLNEMNARHAKEYADCTRAETMDLLKRGSAVATAVIRGLSDDQLAKKGQVLAGSPPMTAEQLITAAFFNHMEEHLASIRKTVGY